MPGGIVTETCPAPECNLTEQDIEQFLKEMMDYIEMFEPAFQREEQLEWSKAYVRGLLGDTPRKNVERMALDWGDKARSMQHFIGQSPWKPEPVIAIHQGLVSETLGEADGVVLIDESGGGQARRGLGWGSRSILWLGGEGGQQSGWRLPGICQPHRLQPD
jgi:hypothetical protein